VEKIIKFDEQKIKIYKELNEISSFDRIRLIDRYSKITEPVFSKLTEENVLEIVSKLLKLKYTRWSLIDTFISGDPVVDIQGYRLEDFLYRELAL
jgi:hypothetical protein